MSEVIAMERPASFGKMLKNIRTSLELSQREVAERFGVTTVEIDMFERDVPVRLGAKIRILRQLYPARHRNT